MFIDIANTGGTTIQGYSYKNRAGATESVEIISNCTLAARDSNGTEIVLYIEDAEKMAKALTLAASYSKYLWGDGIGK